ncbi:hypothetical protein DEO72_LG1g1977 [Vigna unguiculata]|uniref:Uncharacterized protein n=1 Tax=Vigna unguiculata TaxID=3917 RepID=A0A4D6KP49_VIGUN|nr:hypothetical protein DEO72_LG1g1977 [Vigna unguiculata]
MLGDRPRAQSLPPYLLFALGADWQAKTPASRSHQTRPRPSLKVGGAIRSFSLTNLNAPATRKHILPIATTYEGHSSSNTTDRRSPEILRSLNVVAVIAVLPILSCIHSADASNKTHAHEAALSPFVSRILANFVRCLRDPDSMGAL